MTQGWRSFREKAKEAQAKDAEGAAEAVPVKVMEATRLEQTLVGVRVTPHA